METKDKIQKIQKIMREFPFADILKMMQVVDWEYRGEPVTLEKIKETAEFCMFQAIRYENQGAFSTGGFLAEFNDDSLSLKFVGYEKTY